MRSIVLLALLVGCMPPETREAEAPSIPALPVLARAELRDEDGSYQASAFVLEVDGSLCLVIIRPSAGVHVACPRVVAP